MCAKPFELLMMVNASLYSNCRVEVKEPTNWKWTFDIRSLKSPEIKTSIEYENGYLDIRLLVLIHLSICIVKLNDCGYIIEVL